MNYFHEAIEGLREARFQEYLSRGLLDRAGCYRRMKEFPNAWVDLNKAKEMAELGSMKLLLCDYHLEAGRLCQAEKKDKDAVKHFKEAVALIEETGYYRRRGEVEKLGSKENRKGA